MLPAVARSPTVLRARVALLRAAATNGALVEVFRLVEMALLVPPVSARVVHARTSATTRPSASQVIAS